MQDAGIHMFNLNDLKIPEFLIHLLLPIRSLPVYGLSILKVI